jgi:hypothetical protein
MDRPRLSESPSDKWIHATDYVEALARKRTARRSRQPKSPRTQPESPRFGLSTLPYVALIGFMLVLTIAIAVAAFPGSQPAFKTHMAVHEPGVAERGWLQNAEQEFHR